MIMLPAMKGIIFFLAVVGLSVLGGCAVAEQDAGEVGQKFERGMRGQGQIVPYSPTSDSFGPEYR